MKHCTLNTLILSLALCRAAALSKRTYKATKAEGVRIAEKEAKSKTKKLIAQRRAEEAARKVNRTQS